MKTSIHLGTYRRNQDAPEAFYLAKLGIDTEKLCHLVGRAIRSKNKKATACGGAITITVTPTKP